MKVISNEKQVTITFDIEKRNERQKQTVKKLLKEGSIDTASRYLASFTGKRNRNLYIPRIEAHGQDLLGNRQPNYFYEKHLEGFIYKGESVRPGEHIPYGDAIGVEIECVIPRAALGASEPTHSCRTCTGNYSMIHCHNLDGDIEDDETSCDGCSNCNCECEDTSLEYRSDLERRIIDTLKKFQVKGVRVKEDGSIRYTENQYGFEFTCLTRVSNLINVQKLCLALKELKAEVNASCGLHVHLDARNGDGRKIANRLKNALPLLKMMVPKSRLNNQYCHRDMSNRGERYAKINKESLRKHRTIEVRMHSGTTDFVKISNWIKTLTLIARAPKPLNEKLAHMPLKALTRLNADNDLVVWVLSRIQKFVGIKETEPCNNEEAA